MTGKALTLEEKLQTEWLKSNRPNAYFETVTDKRTDNLIGIGVSYIDDEKKISDVIIKRRSIKDTNGEIVYHYFTKNGKVFLKEEVLIIKET